MAKKKPDPPKPTWAYAYQLTPPQRADRLSRINAILLREQAKARKESRTWTGSVISEEQVTHILVVSDSPEQDGEINRRLEAKLRELDATFSVTTPMVVTES